MMRMIGVRKRFGATVALDGVDFAAAAGQVHALVGENGAGKSTLMKVLSGAIAADDGEMLLDGQPYRPRNPLDARRAGVAMIYQELSLCGHLSVQENILLGMEPATLGIIHGSEIRRRAQEAMGRLQHLEIPLNTPVRRLPVASQQLVEIARALAIGCRVLVLDEPTSSLPQQDVTRLFALIDTLKRQGLAIIYISHFLEEVKQVADRYTVLRDGRSVGGGNMAEATTDQIVTMMVGRQIDELYPRSRRTIGEAVLDVSELAGIRKPQSASFTLHRGEVLGIAGLVGAGRTELLRALFGLEPVRSGQVRLGACIGPASPARRWAQGAGLLSEDRKSEGLALSMSVADNLTLSKLDDFGAAGLLWPWRQNRAASDWIDALGIRCRDAMQPIGDLSGGNQQKVAIARLLHHDVDVLLLDEPTRGIDVGSKSQIYQLIDAMAGGSSANPPVGCAPRTIGDARAQSAPYAGKHREGKAILIVSSYLPELLGICDRIAVMHRGVLGPARPVAQCDARQLMFEATGAGEAA